jgi:hypothetical protein
MTILKKEFGINMKEKKMQAIQICCERYTDRNAYRIDKEQMTLFWALKRNFAVLQLNGITQDPVTMAPIQRSEYFGDPDHAPYWYTNIAFVESPPIRGPVMGRNVKWGPIVFEGDADPFRPPPEPESDWFPQERNPSVDVPNQFIEHDAACDDEDEDPLDALIVGPEDLYFINHFIDNDARMDDVDRGLPFPENDPPLPDWLANVIERHDEERETSPVHESWIENHYEI